MGDCNHYWIDRDRHSCQCKWCDKWEDTKKIFYTAQDRAIVQKEKLERIWRLWAQIKKETEVVRSKYPGETWYEITPHHALLLDAALLELESDHPQA